MNITLNNLSIELSPNVKLDYLRNDYPNTKWWNEIIFFLEEWASDSKTVNLKSSGSTGEPKFFKINKSMLWISASKTCEYFGLNKNSIGLLCLSANYIAGKMMLVRAMVSGMNLLCVEPSSNPMENLMQEIDFAAMVPMQVKKSIQNTEKLNLIKLLIIGGGQVSTGLLIEMKPYKGFAYETFGMTETLSHIALRKLTPTLEDYFYLMNGVFINQGFNNQMVIDYPELGIYKLKTNDIIELAMGGGFKWIGRTDFIINSGGVKISPEQIEKKISGLLTERYCITGIPNEDLGEMVVLIIEGASFDTTNLLNQIKNLLPSYSCPKKIKFIDIFPETESGKIDRNKITF